MATSVLITVDTELSAGRHAAGLPLEDNHAMSIAGATAVGNFGISWQMERLDERGLRAVYFVDPMPGLIFGPHVVERVVTPILQRGHEVQLHIHTEWLEWAKESPVDRRTGKNIGDFTQADQVALIGWAADALVAAGAPRPAIMAPMTTHCGHLPGWASFGTAAIMPTMQGMDAPSAPRWIWSTRSGWKVSMKCRSPAYGTGLAISGLRKSARFRQRKCVGLCGMPVRRVPIASRS
jgi:hypothetical protein